jgi:hypothetical protein
VSPSTAFTEDFPGEHVDLRTARRSHLSRITATASNAPMPATMSVLTTLRTNTITGRSAVHSTTSRKPPSTQQTRHGQDHERQPGNGREHQRSLGQVRHDLCQPPTGSAHRWFARRNSSVGAAG